MALIARYIKMIRLFKKRSFTHGTYVEIKVSDNIHKDLITGILQLVHDQSLYSIGPGQCGNGGYFHFHKKEDARIIKRFVNQWTKDKKAEIQKAKRRF